MHLKDLAATLQGPKNAPPNFNVKLSGIPTSDRVKALLSRWIKFFKITNEIVGYIEGYQGEYIKSGVKNIFDQKSGEWTVSSDEKTQHEFTIGENSQQPLAIMRGKLQDGEGPFFLPPDTQIDINDFRPDKVTFFIDELGNIFYSSQGENDFACKIYPEFESSFSHPHEEDSRKYDLSGLIGEAASILGSFEGEMTDIQRAENICNFIRSKKYNVNQSEIFSGDPETLFLRCILSEYLDCYGANTLFVILCRYFGVPSRLAYGYLLDKTSQQSLQKISTDIGHVWSEIWDGEKWVLMDATPKQEENCENTCDSKTQNPGNDPSGKDNDEGEAGPGDPIDGGISLQGDSSGQETSPITSSETSGESLGDIPNDFQNLKEQIQSFGNMLSHSDNITDLKQIFEELSQKIEKFSGTGEEQGTLKNMLSNASQQLHEKITQILITQAQQIRDNDLAPQSELVPILTEISQHAPQKISEIEGILEEKKKRQRERMQELGFFGNTIVRSLSEEEIYRDSEEEIYRDYEKYLSLEREVRKEIVESIKKLKSVLPKKKESEYEGGYNSGSLDMAKITDIGISLSEGGSPDEAVFQRQSAEKLGGDIKLFESIVIDRTGSMGNITTAGSPLREAVKAAIVRAKSLESYDVAFQIVLFDTQAEVVMDFGESFTRNNSQVPGKLMRALRKSGYTDISSGLLKAYEGITEYDKRLKRKKKRALGNIILFSDGDTNSGAGVEVQKLVARIKRHYGLSAFYIGSPSYARYLQGMVGKKDTIITSNVGALSQKIFQTFSRKTSDLIKRFNIG